MAAQKKPVYLTPQGLERHKAKLKHLIEVKRKEISEYMGSAIADGDLRESAAYDEARLLQSANEAEIANLEELINRAVIIEPKTGADASAALGAIVVLEDEDGDHEIFHLVGTHEADFLAGRISDESPFGEAMLGKREGETVNLPDGDTYTIKEITFE